MVFFAVEIQFLSINYLGLDNQKRPKKCKNKGKINIKLLKENKKK